MTATIPHLDLMNSINMIRFPVAIVGFMMLTVRLVAQQPTTPPKDSVLPPIVKGLGIGMQFSELEAWFDEHLKDTILGFEILSDGDNKAFLIAQDAHIKHLQYLQKDTKNMPMFPTLRVLELQTTYKEQPSLIWANSSGKVDSIVLGPSLVNYFFQAKDISSENFTKTFVDSYKLDGMNSDESSSSSSYTTTEGVKITLSRDKSVTMKKVTPPADVKRAFD